MTKKYKNIPDTKIVKGDIGLQSPKIITEYDRHLDYSPKDVKLEPVVLPNYNTTSFEPKNIYNVEEAKDNPFALLLAKEDDYWNAVRPTDISTEFSKSNKTYISNKGNSEKWSSSNNHYRPLENNNNFFVERESSNNDIKIEIGEHKFSANGYLVLSIILGVIIIGLLATRK